MKLRRFLYLDGVLVNEFLAQVEGGIFEEEDLTETSSSTRSGGGKIGAGPVQVGGRAGSGSDEARAKRMLQVDESRFTRLAASLEESEQVPLIEHYDVEQWAGLSRGDVLEIECSITVPTVVQLAEASFSFGAIAELAEASGTPMDMDTSSTQGIEALQLIAGMMDGIPIVCRIRGEEEFSISTTLNPAYLRKDIGSLTGEARLSCTFDRLLSEGESLGLVDHIPALRNPIIKESMGELDEIKELEDATVKPPAAVVSSIAVFR